MDIAIEDLMECFVNPTKSSILLAIQQAGQCTAKELMAQQPEIPQATLYRTLKQLTTVGIINVVSEKQIRAVVERTYALSEAFMANAEQIVTENNGPAYFHLMSSFTLQLMAEFKAYSERANIDIRHDGSGFSAMPIYVNEQELQELAQGIAKVVAPYQQRSTLPNAQQQLHTMALIFTPPRESQHQEKSE